MAIGEWVAPQGEQMARNYRAQAMYGGSLLSTQQGLWAKDGNNFVYIERVKGDNSLGGVSIYSFNDQRRLQAVRYAASATFDAENKLWRLSQVDESNLKDPKQITGSQTVSGTWKTNLTPDKLGVVALDPDALSISGLHVAAARRSLCHTFSTELRIFACHFPVFSPLFCNRNKFWITPRVMIFCLSLSVRGLGYTHRITGRGHKCGNGLEQY
jgi:hypothetical protein